MKEVVDGGGAHGATLSSVVQKAPSMPGVTHVGGDMFESVPSGDVILLQRVLHDWNNEESVKILKKCHAALPDSGKVLIMEMILAQLTGNEDVVAKNTFQMDIGLLIKPKRDERLERTVKEFQMLAIEAGFAGTTLVCEADLYGVVECYKKL